MSDTSVPAPEVDELTRPFWETLKTSGTLSFQRCKPVAMPGCRRAASARTASPPTGSASRRVAARLVSWVVYHIAYNPAFEKRLPYTVAVVQLDEGPRMMSNIVGAAPASLRIDQKLRLVVEREGELAVPRFTPA